MPTAALEYGIVHVEGGESDDGDLEYEFDDALHADDDVMASASDAEERIATSSFFGEWDIGDADLDEALLAYAPAQVASVVDGAEVVGHALELAPDDSAVVESAPLLLLAAPVARDGFDRRGEVVCLTLPECRLKFYHKSNIFVVECTIEEHQRELPPRSGPTARAFDVLGVRWPDRRVQSGTCARRAFLVHSGGQAGTTSHTERAGPVECFCSSAPFA